MSTPPFGFVIDDDGPDKQSAGGAAAFAAGLAEHAPDPGHMARCPACQLLNEDHGCVGLISTPISAAAERWLVERLPGDIESLPGYLLRKAITDNNYRGELADELRRAGLMEAKGPFTRHYGPFFRRLTITSEVLVEELLCVGDIAPAHALAVLVHLGAIDVDGAIPMQMERGPVLGELMEDVARRRERTKINIEVDAEDDTLLGLQRYLRALWAAFALDVTVKVFAPETDDEASEKR